jgi:hypothetical protein
MVVLAQAEEEDDDVAEGGIGRGEEFMVVVEVRALALVVCPRAYTFVHPTSTPAMTLVLLLLLFELHLIIIFLPQLNDGTAVILKNDLDVG